MIDARRDDGGLDEPRPLLPRPREARRPVLVPIMVEAEGGKRGETAVAGQGWTDPARLKRRRSWSF
jgi:hypothetical protein